MILSKWTLEMLTCYLYNIYNSHSWHMLIAKKKSKCTLSYFKYLFPPVTDMLGCEPTTFRLHGKYATPATHCLAATILFIKHCNGKTSCF